MLIFSVLFIYIAVAVFVFCRYSVIAKRFYQPVKESGVEVNTSQWIIAAMKDSIKWPWYVIWFGLKQWIEDMR